MGARRIRAIVWDMDGTLIDSSAIVPAAFIAAVERLGGPRYTPHEVVAGYHLGPPLALLTHLLGRPATHDDVAVYHAQLAATASAVRPYPGIAAALGRLAGTVPMAVFTGASARAAAMLLEAAGLAGCFDALVGGDEVPRPKPHPDGIVAACAALGVAPADAAYVGDAPVDLEAARRAGAVAICPSWGHQSDPAASAELHAATQDDLVRWLSTRLAAG